jgi:hypothetical protein
VPQKITFPAANSPALLPGVKQYAGQQLVNGSQAKAYANDFINVHLSKVAGGQTYAQVSAAAIAAPTNATLAGFIMTDRQFSFATVSSNAERSLAASPSSQSDPACGRDPAASRLQELFGEDDRHCHKDHNSSTVCARASYERALGPCALIAATDWMEVAAIAQVATAGIAVFALVGVIIQLGQNRRHARADRAHQYLERYGDPREISLNAMLYDFIKVEPVEEAGRQELWQRMPSKQRLEIIHGLNFWEELAGMYHRHLVDRRIVRDYFGGSAIAYWQWAQWFITYRRDKQQSDELMKELEDMCSQIERGERARAQRMTFPYARQRRGRTRARR